MAVTENPSASASGDEGGQPQYPTLLLNVFRVTLVALVVDALSGITPADAVAVSRLTSFAGLSSRRPTNVACRI